VEFAVRREVGTSEVAITRSNARAVDFHPQLVGFYYNPN
jgi:hypothetical protein